ncbi:MAG: autotransporter-associated beta strand repeat-containing protein [Opitutae bacterium]|nr:autotransporter-associated beta strand repeat-containing protein [Opitutae bacterium]
MNTRPSLSVGANNRDATFSGSIFGEAASITKAGAGTWTLTGNNTFNAPFNITGGAVAIDTDARLGNALSTLTLDGGTLRTNAAIADLRALAVGANGGTLDTQGFNVTQTGGLTGMGALTKLGSGTLTLAAVGTLSGDTRLAAGTLALGDDTALGTGTLQFDGGTLQATGGPRTLANAVSLNADTTVSGSTALTFAGPLTLTRNRDLTVANTALTTISGSIGESGGPRSLNRYGAGELVLAGASTYTGGTLLAEGTTRISNSTGSAFGTGAVTLASGATLTGAGLFSGALQNNGTYAPGNSPTLATLSSFNQGSTGTLVLEIAGLARGTGYDALDITGVATFGGTLEISFYNGFNVGGGESFDLFNWGGVSGAFATLNLPALTAGLEWDTSALYTTGVLGVSAIPEPSTCAAMSAATSPRRSARWLAPRPGLTAGLFSAPLASRDRYPLPSHAIRQALGRDPRRLRHRPRLVALAWRRPGPTPGWQQPAPV